MLCNSHFHWNPMTALHSSDRQTLASTQSPHGRRLACGDHLVLLSGGSPTFPTPQLTDHVTSHPPVSLSLLFFLDKCVTGAVRTSPVTAASCSSTGGAFRMGRAWDTSAIH